MSKFNSDDTFDRAMRDRYREAVQHVSPATRSRLRANRHAAARGESMPVRGWPLGAAFGGLAAVVFAITLGLNFNQGLQIDDAQPAPQAASDMLATVADDLPLVTALDQDPDFYVWLASSDAQLMATE
ncbi:MAG: hypothetical protein LH470_00630 [Lysobacter sp.]|nr:hypothetical protein [Lysobacter sp.]